MEPTTAQSTEPQAVVAKPAAKALMAVEVMEGVTFSTLLILFSYLYVAIATSTFAAS